MQGGAGHSAAFEVFVGDPRARGLQLPAPASPRLASADGAPCAATPSAGQASSQKRTSRWMDADASFT
eukprot:2494699-Prymnesium_polylepis.1